MRYLAHSARDGYPEQSYREHIENVCCEAMKNAKCAAEYAAVDGEALCSSVEAAARVHDLGKLDEDNQKILKKESSNSHLRWHHQDAGVAYLKQLENSFYAQLIVSSHHSGLPDFFEEERRKDKFFRDTDREHRNRTDQYLPDLIALHKQIVPHMPLSTKDNAQGNQSVFSRIALSCMVDADHTDTANHYKNVSSGEDEIGLQPEKRLALLDDYVASFDDNGERNKLRSRMYHACRDSVPKENITFCDSPVGSGKTTAVMAHLLQQAIGRKARRIFVILPFTNIIAQSVRVYREALVLPSENPEAVVAELHHNADFDSPDIRDLTARWRAPIIVTTAVAFFETLASNRPAMLRKLHELPGSVIFVDEAHAALPVKLLPIAWHWMHILADEWSCYWVLASGSLVKFWDIEEIKELTNIERDVQGIISADLGQTLMQYENRRIEFCYKKEPLSRTQLVEWVASSPGPRLLIMNTVQRAAVMALDLQKYYGEGSGNKVMHLSTALNAEDREITIRAVRERLADKENNDWILVATSCVEAGVDFSFKTGFREIASLLSLLQAAGRINRNGFDDEAKIWSFTMQEGDPMLSVNNDGIKDSAYFLCDYFEQGYKICPELSTKSIKDELNRQVMGKSLLDKEMTNQFPQVENEFKVIDDNTVLVVAEQSVKDKILYGGCDWRMIQRKAVSVRFNRVKELKLKPIVDGIYNWDLGYDSFLGIMQGYLSYLQAKDGILLM